ncbi:unnamed protein product [Heligmosomoides polygyrus]|uniref:C2H2-type domain-containing protein n=1 Tax=Heligmosomoides polygyrus TaxID=6339 RepID=A0A183FBE6_HELPZ|nr:unnamed protein product [Heligmosomoides polygyrus]
MHGDKNGERLSTVTCPGCPDLFDSNIQLARHCHEKHNDDGVDFTIIEKEFPTLDMFEMTECVKGNIEVVASFGHYGHGLNPALSKLPAEDECYIKDMLVAGIPPQKGLNASLGNNLIRKLVNETSIPQFETSFSSYLTWLGSIEAMIEVFSEHYKQFRTRFLSLVQYVEKNYSDRRRE